MRKNTDFQMRLEYVGDNASNASGHSEKYWEAVVVGTRLIRRWGKIGTIGQTKTETFSSAFAAKDAAMKMVEEKRKKGYTLEIDVITLLASLADEVA